MRAGAADGKILKPAADKRDHFAARGLGLHEAGIGFVELEQLALEGRELEEVVLFAHCLGDAPAVGAGRAWRHIDPRLIGDAILAGVGALVDEAAIAQGGKELLHAALVPRFGGPDEVVVGEAKPVPEAAKLGGDLGLQTPAACSPASFAERSIFCPCSSVPVRNQVSMPSARLRRAMASHTMVE